MSDASVDVYSLPHRTTCHKAVAYLHEKGVPIRGFRDLKAQALERAEVEDVARKVAGRRRCSASGPSSTARWACTSKRSPTTTCCG